MMRAHAFYVSSNLQLYKSSGATNVRVRKSFSLAGGESRSISGASCMRTACSIEQYQHFTESRTDHSAEFE